MSKRMTVENAIKIFTSFDLYRKSSADTIIKAKSILKRHKIDWHKLKIK